MIKKHLKYTTQTYVTFPTQAHATKHPQRLLTCRAPTEANCVLSASYFIRVFILGGKKGVRGGMFGTKVRGSGKEEKRTPLNAKPTKRVERRLPHIF